jgi:hypothetical protein
MNYCKKKIQVKDHCPDKQYCSHHQMTLASAFCNVYRNGPKSECHQHEKMHEDINPLTCSKLDGCYYQEGATQENVIAFCKNSNLCPGHYTTDCEFQTGGIPSSRYTCQSSIRELSTKKNDCLENGCAHDIDISRNPASTSFLAHRKSCNMRISNGSKINLTQKDAFLKNNPLDVDWKGDKKGGRNSVDQLTSLLQNQACHRTAIRKNGFKDGSSGTQPE